MTYVVIVRAQIKPGSNALLMEELQADAEASRAEPGCLQFDVLVDPQDHTRIALYEVYADEAAFEAHQKTAHHRRYFGAAHDLLSHREKTALQRVSPNASIGSAA